MFEEEAKRSFNCKKVLYKWETDKCSYIDGFKDGAKSREKRIAELESQIEKMKYKDKIFEIYFPSEFNKNFVLARSIY